MVTLSRDEKIVLRAITDEFETAPSPKIDASHVQSSALIKLRAAIGLRHVNEALRNLGSEEPAEDADPVVLAIERLGDKLVLASMIAPQISEMAGRTLGNVSDAHRRGDKLITVDGDNESENSA